MELRTNIAYAAPLKIGIVGAGFSGTALAASLHRFSQRPLEITLFDKTGTFGHGDAYRTPFPHHLLNVRAQDMSLFEDDAHHFVRWLTNHPLAASYLDTNVSTNEQFVPRLLYGKYLQHTLDVLRSESPSYTQFHFEPSEVIDILPVESQAELRLKNRKAMRVDKVILALGNNAPAPFPFPVAPEMNCIINSWDYTALNAINKHDPVMIVGTGLSMIDAVLTLHHQQHVGDIYALSRHGLLPLSHADNKAPYFLLKEELPAPMRHLAQYLRRKSKYHIQDGGDWRSVVNALRQYIPHLWERASVPDKKQFLRHVLPYWNIHRHRVHREISDLLSQLQAKKQLHVLSGRILFVDHESAHVKLRNTQVVQQIKTKWLINCMGPALMMNQQSSLVQSLLERDLITLDPLQLGFATDQTGAVQTSAGVPSSLFYALGPVKKGVTWECSAVPEIRKQSMELARHLLA